MLNTGVPGNLGSFPQDVAILGHTIVWASQDTTSPSRDVILLYPAPFVKYTTSNLDEAFKLEIC